MLERCRATNELSRSRPSVNRANTDADEKFPFKIHINCSLKIVFMDHELNFCLKNRLFGSFMSSSSFTTFVILTKT